MEKNINIKCDRKDCFDKFNEGAIFQLIILDKKKIVFLNVCNDCGEQHDKGIGNSKIINQSAFIEKKI